MRISRLWCGVPVLLSMCLSPWTWLSAHVQGTADSENPGSHADGPGARGDRFQRNQEFGPLSTKAPSGISTVNLIDASRVGTLFDPSNPTLNAYTNPNTAGLTFRTSWADVEPEEGQFEFRKIDTVLANAETNGKWVRLILLPGFGTPSWALQGVQSGMFSIQYGPGTGTARRLPMPWDSVYLNRWFAFLKQLSERYGKSPALRLVAAAGPTSVSDEFTLPNSPQELKTWQDDSYTPSRWMRAWQQVFQAYAADFPNQYISLSFGGGLAINDQGKIDARERARTRLAVIELAKGILGRRMALQSCNLDGIPSDDAQLNDLLMSYSGRIVTGFMLRTSARGPGMGAAGDPPSLTLRKTIDKGMRPNAAGQSINYLEIYEPDVLADDLQPVLNYGASLFVRKHTPQ
jgi:hypothetical protein